VQGQQGVQVTQRRLFFLCRIVLGCACFDENRAWGFSTGDIFFLFLYLLLGVFKLTISTRALPSPSLASIIF
jgi:hypothetical protein